MRQVTDDTGTRAGKSDKLIGNGSSSSSSKGALLPEICTKEGQAQHLRSKWRFGAYLAALSLLLGGSALIVFGSKFHEALTLGTRENVELDDQDEVNISDFLPDDPQGAREAARVKDDSILPGVENYAAYATVDADKGNHLFWWYLAPQKKQERFPVLIWLQGGPGASSLFGLFSEFGPYKLDEKLEPIPRDVHWNKEFGLLFVDNPVGTGFSYTDTGSYCNSTKNEVSDQLFSLLEQFFTTFPELKEQADFYVSGESYGGHYVSGLGLKLLREVKSGRSDIPFKGVSMGNAWVDPVNQVSGYPAMLYNIGLITQTERKVVQSYCDKTISFIKSGDYTAAFRVWDEMINGDLYGFPPYITNVTGLADYFNYLNTREPVFEDYFADYVQLAHVRKAIHVGNRPFGKTSKEVENALRSDFMKSFKEEVEDLLSNDVKVLIYNGQLDVIINPALTRGYLELLQWPGREEHLAQNQHVWRLSPDDKRVLGYIKAAKGLTSAIVRGAGHMCPSDQSTATYDLIYRFFHDMPYN